MALILNNDFVVYVDTKHNYINGDCLKSGMYECIGVVNVGSSRMLAFRELGLVKSAIVLAYISAEKQKQESAERAARKKLEDEARAERERQEAEKKAEREKRRNIMLAVFETREMIRIPGGDYSLGRSEVTQGQWELIMNENPSIHKGSDLPVENVSLGDCRKFIANLAEKARLAAEEAERRRLEDEKRRAEQARIAAEEADRKRREEEARAARLQELERLRTKQLREMFSGKLAKVRMGLAELKRIEKEVDYYTNRIAQCTQDVVAKQRYVADLKQVVIKVTQSSSAVGAGMDSIYTQLGVLENVTREFKSEIDDLELGYAAYQGLPSRLNNIIEGQSFSLRGKDKNSGCGFVDSAESSENEVFGADATGTGEKNQEVFGGGLGECEETERPLEESNDADYLQKLEKIRSGIIEMARAAKKGVQATLMWKGAGAYKKESGHLFRKKYKASIQFYEGKIDALGEAPSPAAQKKLDEVKLLLKACLHWDSLNQMSL